MASHSENAEPKYWAFISYSSQDQSTAEWLHKRLESFSIPNDFRGSEVHETKKLGKHLRPIFRDRDELSAGASLGPAIEGALRDSCFLIVLCSPAAAQSEWVDKEIEYFKSIGRKDSILALILSGEPNASSKPSANAAIECFPPALRLPFEPIAGDLRKTGDGKTRGFVKILAGLMQVGFDDLWVRHQRELKRKRIVAGIATILVLTLILTFALKASLASKNEKVQAARAENLAEKWLPEGSNPPPLIRSIVDGDLSGVKSAAAAGDSLVDPFGSDHLTPLMLACLAGHQEVVKWLLSNDVPTLVSDSKGLFAIHHAAIAGHTEIIQTLAEQGVELDTDGAGIIFERPIDQAARHGRLPAIELLLELGVPIERELSPKHPLAAIARIGTSSNRATTQPNPFVKNPRTGKTSPLFVAIEDNQIEVVRLLLNAGAKTDLLIGGSMSVFELATQRGRWEIVDLLVEAMSLDRGQAYSDCLLRLLTSNDGREKEAIEMATMFIDRGADLTGAVQTLVGSSVNDRILGSFEEKRRTRKALWKLLISRGAGTEDRDKYEKTALHSSASVSDLSWAIPTLIESGANLEARDRYQRTPLIVAVDRDNVDGVKLLLDAGADVNAKDKHGKTALLDSASEVSIELATLLVEAGAEIQYTHQTARTDGSLRSPENFDTIEAAERRNPEVANYLKSAIKK